MRLSFFSKNTIALSAFAFTLAFSLSLFTIGIVLAMASFGNFVIAMIATLGCVIPFAVFLLILASLSLQQKAELARMLAEASKMPFRAILGCAMTYIGYRLVDIYIPADHPPRRK